MIEVIIGLVLLIGGAGLGASLKSEQKPTTVLKSELMECRAFCGKGRTLTYDRVDGTCECINQK